MTERLLDAVEIAEWLGVQTGHQRNALDHSL